MPPSAGACHTTDASLRPDWGRATRRSSSMTAIGRRSATPWLTGRPVSGEGTFAALGCGVAVGTGLGSTDALGCATLGTGLVLGSTEGADVASADDPVLAPGTELAGGVAHAAATMASRPSTIRPLE